MAWTADIYPHIQPYEPNDLQIFPAPQQPTTILQQLPATMMPPDSAPSIRPGGHVKEDLVALMMIQNAQMHQVIMSSVTVSALGSFGYFSPGTDAEPPRELLLIQEDEADPEVHHHYYEPAPHLSSRLWVAPQATALYQEDLNKSGSALPHSDRNMRRERMEKLCALSQLKSFLLHKLSEATFVTGLWIRHAPTVAPPPPSSSTSGTLGVDTTPAAEDISAAEGEEKQKSK